MRHRLGRVRAWSAVSILVAGAVWIGCAALLNLDVQYAGDGGPEAADTAEELPEVSTTDVLSDASATGPADTGTADGDSAVIAERAADTSAGGEASADTGTDEAADVAPPPPPTDAGIQFVQVTATDFHAASGGSFALVSPVTAHDAIIVAVGYDALSSLQITDSFGSTYRLAASTTSPNPGGAVSAVWYALDVAGGVDTLTFALQAPGAQSASYFEIYLHEYAGIAAWDIGDAQNGSSVTTPTISSGFATTTRTGDLIFGYGVDGTVLPDTSFTARSMFNADLTEDMIAGPPGPYQATAVASQGSNWAMVMAAFKGF